MAQDQGSLKIRLDALSGAQKPASGPGQQNASGNSGPPPLPGSNGAAAPIAPLPALNQLLEQRTAPPPAAARPVASHFPAPPLLAAPPIPPAPSGLRSERAISQGLPVAEPLADPAPPDRLGPEPVGGDGEARRAAKRRPAGPSRPRVAANDDAPTIGGLIYALNQKPSNKPFFYATVASSVWSVLALGFGGLMVGPEITKAGLAGLLTSPALLTAIITLIGPIALFWLLATLLWRADELRLKSSAMTEVAIRLAEPDRGAEAAVASLGQQVRRQVGFMNEAVEKALHRASELESLVQSEVAALDRSYEENERKIRGLIKELASERTALLSTSGDITDSLRAIGTEVPALIGKLTDQQLKLSGLIEGAGENLTMLESALGTKTQALESTLTSRSSDMQQMLESYTLALRETLTERAGEMKSTLGNYTATLDQTLTGRSGEIQLLLESQAGKLESTLGSYAGRIDQSLTSRAAEMRGMLETSTSELDQTLAARSGEVREMLQSYTGQLDETLTARSEEMQGLLDAYTVGLDQAIETRSTRFEGILEERTAALQAVFDEYARTLDTSLGMRIDTLDSTLISRTRALDDAFTNRLQLFDESIQRSAVQIDGAIGETVTALTGALDSHAQTMSSAMDEHARTMTDTIGKQAVELDETILNGITAVRRSSENITRQSIKAIEGLAGQADFLKSVSENLLTQVGSVTNRFEQQGQTIMRAANALEAANYKIDTTLQARSVDLSNTLERLSGKADDFGRVMQGYQSSIEGSLTDAEKRARRAAEELKLTSETTQRATLADIERLRLEASGETERALGDLRQKFSSVTQEVSERLGTLTDTVDQSSSDLRQRAARVASELEAEQARLRQSLEQIPAVSRENSEAVRRSIQDQLRALEQLSAFSSREAGRRDVVPPQAALPPPASHTPSPAQPDPGSPVTTLSRDPQRPLASLTSTLAQELANRQRPSAPAQSQPAPPAAPGRPTSAPPPASAQNEGWSMGDLLKRASHDEERVGTLQTYPSTPLPSQPMLPRPEAPPLDIATLAAALDTSTAAGLWARFRAGQRGFMVRSVYAEAGRFAFDEASQRYRSEPVFRDSVNRFLMDFEAILRQTEIQDPSGQSVQSMLVSDMGRVYLLLAHVAGRLV